LDGSDTQKKEVVDILLKLIQPRIVAATESSPETQIEALVSPTELMMMIHVMEEEIGLKAAVEATTLCFATPQIFTQEIIAVVLQQLVDQSKLPTLMMRTVIQSVTLYKELSGFVNSIMQRLIQKKIWTLPKLWEGFIRCCAVR
jgi:symplekin